MRLGFLGGTGVEGKGLALRFGASGAHVVLGSRSRERAADLARECSQILGKSVIQGTTNGEMLAESDIVFLTVPFDRAVAALQSSRADFRPGHVLVDVTVPMTFTGGRAEYLEPEGRSNAEMLAADLPQGVELVGAFKTIPAHVLTDLSQPLDCDAFVCGDTRSAREKVMDAIRLIPSIRPLDAGPLSNARILERMTLLAVHLNRRYKSKGARFRVVGV